MNTETLRADYEKAPKEIPVVRQCEPWQEVLAQAQLACLTFPLQEESTHGAGKPLALLFRGLLAASRRQDTDILAGLLPHQLLEEGANVRVESIGVRKHFFKQLPLALPARDDLEQILHR